MQKPTFALVTIAAGLLLAVIGLGFGLNSTSDSLTRFIPLLIGIPILIAGFVALFSPPARKHAAHVALLFAVIAVLGSGMKIPGTLSNPEATSQALASQLLTLLVAAGYLALGIRSFLDARRKRKELARAAKAAA